MDDILDYCRHSNSTVDACLVRVFVPKTDENQSTKKFGLPRGAAAAADEK